MSAHGAKVTGLGLSATTPKAMLSDCVDLSRYETYDTRAHTTIPLPTAQVGLLGKPIAESSALCIPTAGCGGRGAGVLLLTECVEVLSRHGWDGWLCWEYKKRWYEGAARLEGLLAAGREHLGRLLNECV